MTPYLLFTVGRRICALSIRHVRETLRPLPVEPAARAPAFVLGTTLWRGVPTPVVDTGVLLGDGPIADPTRLVALHTEDGRPVGLLATTVLGVRTLGVQGTLPLLADDREVVAAVGRLDHQLLTVLRAGRILAGEVA